MAWEMFEELEEEALATRRDGAFSARHIWVVLAIVAVYIALACSGYATFGSKVASDILSSYPPASPLVGVARVMIALVVTCCYPLQAHPSRLSLGSILKKVLGPARAPSDTALHWGITAAFVGASTAIAFARERSQQKH